MSLDKNTSAAGLRDRLVQRMRGLGRANTVAGESTDKAKGASASTGVNRRLAEFTRFDSLPGYRKMLLQAEAAARKGIGNPFFLPHDGVAGATTTIRGEQFINYSSYNYLGLCGHPELTEAVHRAVAQYGTSASASRLVSGERPIQRELEAELAELHGVEDCVVFVSGHATNVSTVGQLLGPRDLVIHDALIHNSIAQGAILSGAQRLSFPHNDWQALDKLLTRHRSSRERVLIVIEGIYSMDGDFPDLARFVEIKNRHSAWLMVDEAHSIGVLGERCGGLAEHCGVSGENIDLHMGTLSKTLAGCGGYIAGSKVLVDFLKFSAPGFVYSVGLSPVLAAASLTALRIMLREPERAEKLRENGQYFLKVARSHGLDTGLSEGFSVVPIVLGSSIRAARASNALLSRGINVQPIVYPAVEERKARLRFFISSEHTRAQIDATLAAVAEELARI